jgi:7,8-dihydropterin-6-yl-methyl-4-(beta-D-ribofuranosyl)aminobenzene 5'-phosphate synthase
LFDVGFGPDSPTLRHNARRLGVDLTGVEAVAISHLHPDHMGGMEAFRSHRVRTPPDMDGLKRKPCFLPEPAETDDLDAVSVDAPRMLASGIGTTGPLARSLFFLGLCEEQALVARLEGRGLVVITGCGHPTVELILKMARRLSDDPIHVIAGVIHFPVTRSRSVRRGIQVQMFYGTGKPPWRKINDGDLSRTIEHINRADPKRVLLSAHDTCDHALRRLQQELAAETTVLEAGASHRF